MTRHPDAAELLAHRDGTLDEDATERMREHLSRCAACRRIVLDLGGAGDEAVPGDDPELDAAWARLEARRATDAVPAPALPAPVLPVPVLPVQATVERWASRSRLAAVLPLLVAGLVASILGLVLQHQALERAEARLDTLTAPRLDVPAVTLLPRGAVRDAGRTAIEAPSGPFVALTLAEAVPAEGSAPRRVEVRDARGTLLWAAETAGGPTESRRLQVLLPRALLPLDGGRLELRVSRRDAPSTDAVVYDLRVSAPVSAPAR